MAISRVKTWSSGEVLTASDLNAEFNNILNNPLSLWSPATAAVDFDGQTLTLDAAAATTVASSASVSWNFTSGAKAGTPATTGSIANWAAQTFTDSATAGSGTATAYVAHGIQRPTLAATNSSVVTTDAATFYIVNAPAAGTNETLTNAYALWIDDGRVRFDPSAAVVSAASATLDAFNVTAQTATISGSTNITTATGVNFFKIGQPTLSAASALTITNAATFYISAAPTGAGAGPATITNAYALWVDAGVSRFDGPVIAQGFNGAIRGFTYTNNGSDATNDLDFTAGGAMDATNAYWIEVAALTKQSDAAWAVGNNQGGLDSIGSAGNNDFYVWAIARPDTGVTDLLYSLSSTAPTMPTNYTFKRLVGWFKRSGGAVVTLNTYETEGGGLEFRWTAPTLDINVANTLTTSRRTDAVKVPLNFSVIAHLNVDIDDAGGGANAWIHCPDHADVAPSTTVAPLSNIRLTAANLIAAGPMSIRTSSTGTIAARATIATVDLYAVVTLGFTWARRN